MTPNRLRVTVVVMGLCIVGLLTAPAAAQSQRQDDGRNEKPERLWRLYPLDPEAGQEDRSQRTKIDTQDPASPISSNREQSRRPDGVTPDRDRPRSNTMPLLTAFTLLCLGSLLIGLVVRRVRKPAPASRHGFKEISEAVVYHLVEEPRPQAPSGRPSAQQSAETGLVRVHLRDGRVVEGEVRHAATHARPVLLLDVVGVSDAQGKKTEPEPLGAFVSFAEVEHIETIGKVHAPVSNITVGRR
jgi:hypothetical protein